MLTKIAKNMENRKISKKFQKQFLKIPDVGKIAKITKIGKVPIPIRFLHKLYFNELGKCPNFQNKDKLQKTSKDANS